MTARLGDRIYMAISVMVRMGVGLAVFVLLARSLGPTDYGLFSTVFAYAMIAGFVTDFGYSVRALRDIAAKPDEGARLLSESLSVKAVLMVIVAAVGTGALMLLPIGGAAKAASLLIGAAVLAGSVADLALVAFRSLGRYSKETRIVLWTSGLHGLVLASLALTHSGVVLVSAGFLFSRVVYMMVALASVRRLFPGQPLRPAGLKTTVTALRGSTSWAADSGLGYLSGQVDALIIPQLLGLAPAGIYQSGGRFSQAALGLAAILSNVHIPRLAGDTDDPTRVRREWRVIAEFSLVGAVFALAMLFAGPLATRYLLGPSYAEVDRLWAGFAAFLFARYSAAGVGVVLSARGRPALRVAAQLAGLLTIVIGFFVALPVLGLPAAPWIMAAGAVTTALVYAAGYFLVASDRGRR
jgi:O-antigen/teichoic acid export membrane protein